MVHIFIRVSCTPFTVKGGWGIRVRTFDFASKATSPASPDLLYSFFKAAGDNPDTCCIALEIVDDPRPNSAETYGGDRVLDSKYNALHQRRMIVPNY